MDNFLKRKIWLIGASVGIGEALAKELAASGGQLALSARSGDKITALAKQLQGSKHIAVPLDVTSNESVHAAWDAIKTAWGGVDTVIYNAGTYDPMSGKDFNLEKIEQMLDVNFRGALRALDCVIPGFVKNRTGHIVLVASVAAYSGLPNAVGYGASKAALLHLAENLYLDLEKSSIKVQVVNPGFVKTRLTDKNTFSMPFIVSAEEAARSIKKGMLANSFEIHFPKRFTYIVKFISSLPYALSLPLLKKV